MGKVIERNIEDTDVEKLFLRQPHVLEVSRTSRLMGTGRSSRVGVELEPGYGEAT